VILPDPLESARPHIEALSAFLNLWIQRDDSRAQPDIRRAGSGAVEAIDALTRELYALRSRLVGEIHASDDATAARVDALLAERQQYRRDAEPSGRMPPRGSVTFGEHDRGEAAL
jgi:hypothetical protein